MNCDAYLELISGHIDGVNNESEEFFLQRHLQHCPHCRELLAAFEEADAQFAAPVQPPVDLSARIMKQVRDEADASARKRRRRFGSIAAILATAALLALVVFTSLPTLTSMDSSAPEIFTQNDVQEGVLVDSDQNSSSGNHDIKLRPILRAESDTPLSIDSFSPSAVEAALPLMVVFSADKDLTEQGTIWLSDIFVNTKLESGTAVNTKTFYLRYNAAVALAEESDATLLLASEGTPADDSFCLIFVIERAE